MAEKMPDAVRCLSHDLLMIEATGDYDGAKAFVAKYGAMPDHLSRGLERLSGIPTDVRPTYRIETQITDW